MEAMLSPVSLTPAWIRAKAAERKPVDPLLLEKCIHALALLGHLSESGLNFLFKGGTSLLLLLNPIRRLSIDIDIVCGVSRRELAAVLESIKNKPPFLRYGENDRGERGLPHRRHFKFYYQSMDSNFLGAYVLLDVVEEARCPHLTQKIPIRVPFIEVEREVLVTLPTIESLLGDKLTAFAPTTVGVPLYLEDGSSGDTMQIAKQMFDIGELFNAATDFQIVRQVYDGVFALEAEYREHRFNRGAALRDTLWASLSIANEMLKGDQPSDDVKTLREGWRRVGSHLIQHKFGLDEARVAAGKTALLAMGLLTNPDELDLAGLRFAESPQTLARIKDQNIVKAEWQMLNRIKNANPAAFHYWHAADELNRIKPV
jgi:hypothetical protein